MGTIHTALPDPDATLEGTATAFRAWLADHERDLEPFRHELAEELDESVARFRPLQQMLWDDGWNRLGWSPEHGGLGGTPVHRFVVAEELAAAGYVIPEILGTIEIIAPMLVRYAPHLAATHLAASLRGDEVWCQGFSEPDAGSDLGSLRTRAAPDGDGFRLDGQKMWSSYGSLASWCCVLARTGASDSGYRGLTMFWVDLSDPGVRVVPTRCATGRSETAEIFLDDVRVPAERLIGDVGEGWATVMYLMQYERGAFAWGRQAEHHSQLRDLIHDHAEEFPAGADEIVGDAYLSMFALRSQARDTIARLAAGEALGPEISVDKLMLSSTEQTITEAARRLLWPRVEIADDATAAWWRQRWAYSRITTIYGGAAEVQRDLVAERLLGLPRGR
ncbi:MAG: acyl-CoA dehydrogenase family protein [Acidimicrobiia bacterium]